MRSSIKPFVLPAAIACGLLFHDAIKFIAPLSPYLIFMMLLLTFTSIDLHKIRLTRLQLWLLLIQISVCWIPYVLLRGYSSDVAAGLFMCVFISTATAAPVVTKMLGGSVEMLVSYSLTSNLAFALLAPPFLSIISDTADVSVAATLLYIARGVLPLLLVPLLVAYLLGRYAPELRSRISRYSSLSFYLWALALLIVVGNAVGLALEQQGAGIVQFAALFVGSAVLCAVQFYAGRPALWRPDIGGAGPWTEKHSAGHMGGHFVCVGVGVACSGGLYPLAKHFQQLAALPQNAPRGGNALNAEVSCGAVRGDDTGLSIWWRCRS